MIGNRPWTPEDDQRLRKLAASATSVAEIAKQLDRGPSAVRTRASVLQIRVARSGYPWAKGGLEMIPKRTAPEGRYSRETLNLVRRVKADGEWTKPQPHNMRQA